MYGTQVHVHRFLLNAKHVRTVDPDEADFFYVPGKGTTRQPDGD